MKALAVVAVLALVSSGAASAGTAVKVPSSKAAIAAFGRYLHHRYGSITGYWTCPRSKAQAFPATGSRSCLAEVKTAQKWHQLLGDARLSRSRVVISVDPHAVTTWVRHWWPYSRRFITVGPKPWPRGMISVNSPAYDWWFLARCAHAQRRQCVGADGLTQGFSRFFLFRCADERDLVVCKNSLGDVMRCRP